MKIRNSLKYKSRIKGIFRLLGFVGLIILVIAGLILAITTITLITMLMIKFCLNFI